MADTDCPLWCTREHQADDRTFRFHATKIGGTGRSDRLFQVWAFRMDRQSRMSGEWRQGPATVSIGLGDDVGHDTGVDDLTADQAAKLARIVEALGDARLAELLDQAVKTIDGSNNA